MLVNVIHIKKTWILSLSSFTLVGPDSKLGHSKLYFKCLFTIDHANDVFFKISYICNVETKLTTNSKKEEVQAKGIKEDGNEREYKNDKSARQKAYKTPNDVCFKISNICNVKTQLTTN